MLGDPPQNPKFFGGSLLCSTFLLTIIAQDCIRGGGEVYEVTRTGEGNHYCEEAVYKLIFYQHTN